jgi:hypothetical protein
MLNENRFLGTFRGHNTRTILAKAHKKAANHCVCYFQVTNHGALYSPDYQLQDKPMYSDGKTSDLINGSRWTHDHVTRNERVLI